MTNTSLPIQSTGPIETVAEFMGSYMPVVGSARKTGGELNNFNTPNENQQIRIPRAVIAEEATRISLKSMVQQLSEAFGTNLQK
ncbi:hypothetical protein A3I48_01285 [Candidatus Daviesbacteria bacterium RIFCSPLOWO2_02_FULL_36_7]|uniref:Uncharacterized protein n=1 Tax=Candidatus Daviesbacteria bacterium RIFCSPLOWO2_02_FULL_36_7 TaxID=1797792 RepID=A0A1F5MHP8_9BACT|nr:MAG: hypothetical protein A3I48_01285 [Candidatus Daviesbacteria bacterium RIFCSPLOWO2_02_FULL_36_7]